MHAARDIVAQDNNVTNAEINDVFDAARSVMSPYDSSLTVLRTRVSDVLVKPDDLDIFCSTVVRLLDRRPAYIPYSNVLGLSRAA